MSSPQTPRLIIVTGVSGSGRASAMRVLEDLGFYCVDNLPVALAPNVAMLAAGRDPALQGVALGVDSRERLFFPQWPRIFAELDAAGIHPEVIFLDASDDVLARRYSESRRPHPMAGRGATVAESIRADRLALAETDQKLAGLNGEVRVLIPKKAMDEVEKLSSAAGADAQIDFAKDESHLFFQVGHRLLISRILTGQFPNYEAVLPRDNNKSVVIERSELSDAVRRVSQLADQRSHAVKLAVSPEGIEISASSPEYGEAKENIEKEYKGDPISIGFNSTYMLDFLAAAADGPISIELKDEQSAGQMRPLADESYRYRYIIMPMRI